MLGAAQSNTLCSIFTRLCGIFVGIGICTHRKLALTDFVCPLQNSMKLFCRFGCSKRHRANHYFASCAIERNNITFTHNCVTNTEHFAVNVHRICANDCWCPPSASYYSSMTHESAASSQDAFCNHHAVHIFWARLAAHQNDSLATSCSSSRIISGEIDRTNGSAWRCSKTLCQCFRLICKLRMQYLIEMLGRHAHQRIFL